LHAHEFYMFQGIVQLSVSMRRSTASDWYLATL
jgi:hypothetical protein